MSVVSRCHVCSGPHSGQERLSYPLELQVVMSHLTGVLGIQKPDLLTLSYLDICLSGFKCFQNEGYHTWVSYNGIKLHFVASSAEV